MKAIVNELLFEVGWSCQFIILFSFCIFEIFHNEKGFFFFLDEHFWHHLKSVCAYPSVHNSLEGTGLKVKSEGSRVRLTTFEFCFFQLLVDLRRVLKPLRHTGVSCEKSSTNFNETLTMILFCINVLLFYPPHHLKRQGTVSPISRLRKHPEHMWLKHLTFQGLPLLPPSSEGPQGLKTKSHVPMSLQSLLSLKFTWIKAEF